VTLAPRAYGALVSISRHIDQAVEVLTSTFLAIIVLINGLELVGRNFFNYSFVWAHEVNLLLGNWVYFIGMTMVYYRNADITIEYFSGLLPLRAQRVWVLVCNLIVLGVLAVIVWYGWVLIELQTGFRTTGMGIPNPWFSAPVVVSALIMAVHVARHSAELLEHKPA
jgi:TRAP-type C4-dicarboxylate transport system permease small subunit